MGNSQDSRHYLYKTNFQWFNKTTYVIKTEENFINIDPDQEEFILLLEKDVGKYKQKYNFLHLGCVQVATMPM